MYTKQEYIIFSHVFYIRIDNSNCLLLFLYFLHTTIFHYISYKHRIVFYVILIIKCNPMTIAVQIDRYNIVPEYYNRNNSQGENALFSAIDVICLILKCTLLF